jgi:hypothetical protein
MGPNQTLATMPHNQYQLAQTGPSLQSLQKLIMNALVNADPLRDHLITAPNRIEVYQQSIEGIHIKALRSTYPVCHKLVGDEFFNTMARVYIKQNPSHTHNLYEYGENFAEFAANFPPAQCLAYLSDLAHLEWAWSKAFHGQDYQPWNSAELLNIAEDNYSQIMFHLPQHSTLLNSPYPIHRIWQVNQENFSEDMLVNLNQGESRLFILRQDRKVNIHSLNDAEWNLLSAITKKVPFATLCEQLAVLHNVIGKSWIERLSLA